MNNNNEKNNDDNIVLAKIHGYDAKKLLQEIRNGKGFFVNVYDDFSGNPVVELIKDR